VLGIAGVAVLGWISLQSRQSMHMFTAQVMGDTPYCGNNIRETGEQCDSGYAWGRIEGCGINQVCQRCQCVTLTSANQHCIGTACYAGVNNCPSGTPACDVTCACSAIWWPHCGDARCMSFEQGAGGRIIHPSATGPIQNRVEGFGMDIVPMGDLDADQIPDVVVLATGNGTPFVSGTIHVIYMNRNGTAKRIDPLPYVPERQGLAPLKLAYAMESVGDIDSNGVPDLALYAWTGTYTEGDYGNDEEIRILRLQRTAEGVSVLADRANPEPQEQARQGYGYDLAYLGNGRLAAYLGRGDSFDEAVGIFQISSNGNIAQIGTVQGVSGGNVLGAPGDLNGDGANDLLWNRTVAFLSQDGTSVLSQQTIAFGSPYFNDGFIHSNPWGDTDGNGVPDLLLGMVSQQGKYENIGIVGKVLLERTSGNPPLRVKSSQIMYSPEQPARFGGAFGRAAANVGDIDGDGQPDIMIGSPETFFCVDGTQVHGCSGTHPGAVWVYLSGAGVPICTADCGSAPISPSSSSAPIPPSSSSVPIPPSSSSVPIIPSSSSQAAVCGDGRFAATKQCEPSGMLQTLPTNGIPDAVRAGDFNADGNADLVTLNLSPNRTGSINVFLGAGDGSFSPGANYQVGNVQSVFQAADAQGDGKLDLLLGATHIMRGNGDGTFQPVSSLLPQGADVAVGDFNEDGRPDIFTTTVSSPNSPHVEQLFAGQAGGGFAAGVTVAEFPHPWSNIVTADFDADGHLDVAYLPTGNSNDPPGLTANFTVQILYGNGNGAFISVPLTLSSWTSGATGLWMADINGDGRSDLYMDGNGNVGPFWLNNGNRTFEAKNNYMGNLNDPAALIDVDGDGKADVITGGRTASPTIEIHKGNGDGSFVQSPLYSFGVTYPLWHSEGNIAQADFDHDGRLDFAIARTSIADAGANFIIVQISPCAPGQTCSSSCQCIGTPIPPSSSSRSSSRSSSSTSHSSSASSVSSMTIASSSASHGVNALCGNGLQEGTEQCEAGIPCYTGLVCMNCLCIFPPSSSAAPPSSTSSDGFAQVTCGNSTLEEYEQCEQGFDFCPPDFLCDYTSCFCLPSGMFSSASSAGVSVGSQPLCGNGVLEVTEQCDTGNPCPGGDFCTIACMCESRGGPVPVAPSTVVRCGDGILGAGEQCESGMPCSDGAFCTTSCLCLRSETVSLCGNGVLNLREECDDGNTENGDGCDRSCRREAAVFAQTCGNGELEGGEQCELNSLCPRPGDQCLNCQCRAVSESACGNGVLEFPEECETTAACAGLSHFCASCRCVPFVCGDNVRDLGEECDDGNTASGDGCSATCQRETINLIASQAICGNGLIERDEECDDGNTVSEDGCSAVCQREVLPPRLELTLLPEQPASSSVAFQPVSSAPAVTVPVRTGPTPKRAVSSVPAFFPAAPVPSALAPSILATTIVQPPSWQPYASVVPYAPPTGPVGATGPASVAAMAAGAAAGWAWMRRRKNRR